MRKSLVLPIALLMGCFAPDLSGITFKCDADRACPDGYTCSTGECKVSGDVPVPTPTDPNGCASGTGIDVSSNGKDRAWACAGTYNSSTNPASRLCATGYRICANATSININNCNSKDGFFLADMPLYWKNFNQNCQASNGDKNDNPAFAGCGKGSSGNKKWPISCGFGFSEAMDDWNNSSLDVSGANTSISVSTTNTESKNGVLCCKN